MIDTAVTPQEPLRATEDGIAVSLPAYAVQACTASQPCTRRAEWTITARDHDGAVLCVYYACHDSMHRGQGSALAWRVEPAVVEVRQYVEVAV